MTIKQIIVHQLDRSPETENLQAIQANDCLTATPALEAMLEDLLQTYNKKQDKQYGHFTEKSEDSLPFQLSQYFENQLSFTELSISALNQLREKLDEAGALGGGYVLFADYQQGLTRYLLLCMLSSQVSVTVTDDLNIEDTSYLDTAKMSLACRINMTEWQKNPESARYLSFLRPRGGKRLSDVFQQAIGCSETSSSKDEADTLVNAVTGYCKEEPSEEHRAVVKRQVYDYCQSKLEEGESLSLEELTGHLSEAGPDAFEKYVNTRDYDMAAPMTPERRTLTKLVRYTGRSKGLNLAFDAELLGSQVRYDEIKDQIIITGVPDKLKDQLKQS